MTDPCVDGSSRTIAAENTYTTIFTCLIGAVGSVLSVCNEQIAHTANCRSKFAIAPEIKKMPLRAL